MATPHDENNGTVSISRVVCVHPKIEQPHRVLSLSNLDRQCPRLMQLVFFYNNLMKNDLSLNSVFNSLKIGLEETLIMWYPGAGRLMMMNPNNNNNNINNQSDGKLNLWCNNEGAILVEAETKARISQLGDLSQYNEFFENLVYKPDFDPNFSNMPLIVAQVTKFGCGGYSIGIGTSHSLFDGPATYDFLYAWASNSEIMKGISAKPLELPKPVHERGILLSSGNNKQQLSKGSLNLPSSSNFYAHDEHNQPIRAMAVQHLYQLIMQATAAATLVHSRSEPSENNYQEKWVLKTYHLSAAMIDNLKRKYLSSIKTGSLPFSTFEVLTAHLWKARIKALRLSKEKVVCLQFAVDTRNKMVPPLPKGFSGNAYLLASLMMSVSQLLDHSSHEFIIEKIREAKNAVNHSYVKSYIDALELGSNNSLPPLKELTLVSDWTRMPFHNIEFFHGRKAAYASPLATPVPQVAYFMQSPFDVGGVDLRIGFQDGITLSAFTQCFLI